MCNLYRIEKNPDAIRRLFADVQIPLTFPEGIPEFPAARRAHFREGADRPLQCRTKESPSWSSAAGRGRRRAASRYSTCARTDGSSRKNRCLVMADTFYEFTTPEDSKQKRKDCWAFRPAGDFAIAGLLRDDPKVGEAFTLLTVPPGKDIARLSQPPDRAAGAAAMARVARRLGKSAEMLTPSEAGSLSVSPRHP